MPNKDLSKLGLVDYLNTTKAQHNNLDFENFKSMLESEKGKVNTSNLARAFNVTRPTIYSWLELYEKLKEEK